MDRLKELKKMDAKEVEVDVSTSGSASTNVKIAEHVKLYEPIKKGLEILQNNTTKLQELEEKEQTTTNTKTKNEIMAQADALMQECTGQGKMIKETLDRIKNENDKFTDSSATTQMRTNLYMTHTRRFHQIMNGFNQVAHDFKTKLQERSKRQLQLVDSKLTPEQIENIVDSGKADEVVASAIISDGLDDALREIEERHKGIMRLEKQVLEIYQLFQDLAALVDLQQETLDVIEIRVRSAKDYTAQGVEQLKQGEAYQIKANKRLCCIFFLVVGIIVAILAPILLTQVGKS